MLRERRHLGLRAVENVDGRLNLRQLDVLRLPNELLEEVEARANIFFGLIVLDRAACRGTHSNHQKIPAGRELALYAHESANMLYRKLLS